MKSFVRRMLLLSAVGATAAAVGIAPAPLARARTGLFTPPQLGIRFNADGDPGQCGGRTGDQWKNDFDATEPIRFDTDSRPGGCQLAFGIYDPDGLLRDPSVTYTFQATPGGDPAQCGNPGTHRMPVGRTSRTFGPTIRIDTDNRPGGCDLTFALSSSIGMSIGVNYSSDGDRAQCGNAGPDLGLFSPVDNDRPFAVRIDTDDRPGGCRLQLRLASFSSERGSHANG
ncbi:hypothetical protein ACFVXG_24490 [Kitasatospora sp. NPDC058162]|uniref:hypothetical protein n=1 Tax=Kitasatospora sp. NPDC058162 TaxID=3346362 RepID=UPI0036DAE19E